MRRIVPSQAIATIHEFVPELRTGDTRRSYDSTWAAVLRAIVDLLDHIPPELLIMPAQEYASYILGKSAIEHQLARWESNHNAVLQPPREREPLLRICQALGQCPDETPPPSTVGLEFIADQDIRENIRRDVGAANLAFTNMEWKAATVIGGAAIEALLFWALGTLASATEVNGAVTALVGKNAMPKPKTKIEQWDLSEFIPVSIELQLIKADTAKACTLAKDFRNLIHPGRASRLDQACDRATALSALAGMEHVIRDLS